MPDRQPLHLKERLAPSNWKQDHEESDKELPDSSSPYQAYARASNKPVYTLHCCLGKDGYRSFQYVHLDSNSGFCIDPKGQTITVRFAGSKHLQVTIRGRNLWHLYDYLHQHRTSWIMRADRDFGEDKEAIITAIEIEEVNDSETEPRP
jgi:hypothetical protein